MADFSYLAEGLMGAGRTFADIFQREQERLKNEQERIRTEQREESTRTREYTRARKDELTDINTAYERQKELQKQSFELQKKLAEDNYNYQANLKMFKNDPILKAQTIIDMMSPNVSNKAKAIGRFKLLNKFEAGMTLHQMTPEDKIFFDAFPEPSKSTIMELHKKNVDSNIEITSKSAYIDYMTALTAAQISSRTMDDRELLATRTTITDKLENLYQNPIFSGTMESYRRAGGDPRKLDPMEYSNWQRFSTIESQYLGALKFLDDAQKQITSKGMTSGAARGTIPTPTSPQEQPTNTGIANQFSKVATNVGEAVNEIPAARIVRSLFGKLGISKTESKTYHYATHGKALKDLEKLRKIVKPGDKISIAGDEHILDFDKDGNLAMEWSPITADTERIRKKKEKISATTKS